MAQAKKKATLVLYLGEENNGMENELPKTEQELNDLIEQKVQEATANLEAKHNGQMATMRKKYDDDIKKAKEQANMTAEEIAQQRIREQQEQDQQELNELRQFKKSSLLSERLDKEGLPNYFKNDTRLLNADDSTIDKVIKDIKKEYEATLPKGASHSTVVQSASGQRQASQDNKTQIYEDVGNALKDALGR